MSAHLTHRRLGTCAMGTLAELAQVGDKIAYLLVAKRVTPGRHKDGLVDGWAAFLDDLENGVVGATGHRLGIRVIARLHRHVPDVDTLAVTILAVALRAIGAIVVAGRLLPHGRECEANANHQRRANQAVTWHCFAPWPVRRGNYPSSAYSHPTPSCSASRSSDPTPAGCGCS